MLWKESGENFSPEDLATPEAFERDPQRVRDFYEYRREFVRKAKPNAGHLAIAAMEELSPEVIVITQRNVRTERARSVVQPALPGSVRLILIIPPLALPAW